MGIQDEDVMPKKKLKIACLGWGSLIWNQNGLPLRSGWNEDGPDLTIEFARESSEKRITLVICDQGTGVRSLWAVMDVDTLEAGISALTKREKVKKLIDTGIGHWDRLSGKSHNDRTGKITSWAAAQEIDGVVLTCSL